MPYHVKDLKRDHNFDKHPCPMRALAKQRALSLSLDVALEASFLLVLQFRVYGFRAQESELLGDWRCRVQNTERAKAQQCCRFEAQALG